MKIVGITGYRPNKLDPNAANPYSHFTPIRIALREEYKRILAKEDPDFIISGMAQGVDLDFVMVAYSMGIKFIACLPCKGQEKSWPRPAQVVYRHMLKRAHSVILVFEDSYKGPWQMLERNKALVNNLSTPTSLLVAVWDGDFCGGTAHCVNYAKQQGKPILRLDPVSYRRKGVF